MRSKDFIKHADIGEGLDRLYLATEQLSENKDDTEIKNYKKLDNILSKLCHLVEQGQKSEKDYGMVAAAVLDPNNQLVARLNRPGQDGKRIHAERAAIEAYTKKYGQIPEGSIILTTLSPCNEHLDERDGPSCTDIVNQSGVKKVYCGYMDPTQDTDTRDFNVMETADKNLRSQCKKFADTFLDHVHEDNSATGVILPRDSQGRPIEPPLEDPPISPEDIIGLGLPALWKTGAKLIPKLGPRLRGLDVTRPAVNNKLYHPYGVSGFPAGSTKAAYNVRGIRNPKEIENLLSNGFLKPNPNTKPGRNPSTTKYFTHTDTPKDLQGYYATIRVPSSKTPSGRAVRSKDVEIFDRETGVWRPLKPGDASLNQSISQNENFADGRNPQDKGDSKRYHVPTKASVSTLRKVAKQGGRKGQLAHWMANMKAGKAKKK